MSDIKWAAIVGAIIAVQVALMVFGRQFDCWVAAKRAGISYAEAREILRRLGR